jgi:GTP-binding protein HflX
VLEEIGAQHIPQILVYNKLDRIEPGQRPRGLRDEIERAAGVRVPRVFVSALTGEGLQQLRELVATFAAPALNSEPGDFILPDGTAAPRH